MRVLICFTLLFTVFAASARSDPVKITAASDPADPVGGEEKPKYKPNLLQVAENLNLTSFLKVVQQCGLHRMINHEGMFTVFAPSNEAFTREKWYPGEDGLCDKIKLHVGWGHIMAANIENDMLVKTLLSKRKVRLNIYADGKVVTANGRKIVDTDHEARNGVLHILDDVMSSVYRRAGSVISELDECCPEHSDLIELIKLAGLYNDLDTKGPFTLLAPNNGAFAKLHPDFIIHLKKNHTALVRLMSAHVLPGTLYSAGLKDGMQVKTLLGNKLEVKIDSNGSIKFGKAEVTLSDVTAGNGAVHAIDEILFPSTSTASATSTASTASRTFNDDLSLPLDLQEGQEQEQPQISISDLCRQKGYTGFADALVATGWDKKLEAAGYYTVFAPTNEAFAHPKIYPGGVASTPTLSDRVAYHIVKGLIKESAVTDELNVPTLLSKRSIRFNVYGKDKTANGLEVVFKGYEAANGIVHEVSADLDYIYEAADGSLRHELGRFPEFSQFVQIMDKQYPGILGHSPAFTLTVLVPDNSVIEAVREAGGLSEEEMATKLLHNHLIPTAWYTFGLMQAIQNGEAVISLGGNDLRKAVDTNGNNIGLLATDFNAKNGVFHQVNGIIA